MIGRISTTFVLSAAALAAQTFTKDIAPILQRSCQNCHRDGSIAPMSLLNYKESRPWARSIKEKVVRRQMPPWHIDRNVGVTKFKDDPSLSETEIATITTWVDHGSPEGSAARQLLTAGLSISHCRARWAASRRSVSPDSS